MFENLYKELSLTIDNGKACALLTYLTFSTDKSGIITDKILVTRDEVDSSTCRFNSNITEEVTLALDTGKPNLLHLTDKQALLIEPFVPNPRLIIFGGGHIAKPLVEYASKAGFNITLIDDRPSFANAARFPEAERVICEGFETSFEQIGFRDSDFVVIITRGHRYDGVVLREVLTHNFRYVGMIGSKRRVKGMMQELLQEGFSQDKLNAVCSPIGLDIGAITPDEIAISIAAQLISYKNKGLLSKFGKNFAFPEFDKEVAQKIAEASDIPKALVTILSSKGSVPRKAGAKMAAYFDGSTIGSIGGGCSESDILTKARAVMGTNQFLIERVDMTNEVAESEGMVCGGVMDVLIEGF